MGGDYDMTHTVSAPVSIQHQNLPQNLGARGLLFSLQHVLTQRPKKYLNVFTMIYENSIRTEITHTWKMFSDPPNNTNSLISTRKYLTMTRWEKGNWLIHFKNAPPIPLPWALPVGVDIRSIILLRVSVYIQGNIRPCVLGTGDTNSQSVDFR